MAKAASKKMEDDFKLALTPNRYSRISPADRIKKATETLKAVRLDLESDQPDDPEIPVGALHPWVSGQAASLWDNGHRRQAVAEAARSIEVRLKAKLGNDGKTTQLMDAFATTPPKPGSPRLRFAGFDEGTDDWTNSHQGTMEFGKGCMKRIRNLYVHGHEPSDAEALEALAALSLLARWIDEASVISATEPRNPDPKTRP